VAMMSGDAQHAIETTERVLERMMKTKTNAEFLATLSRGEV